MQNATFAANIHAVEGEPTPTGTDEPRALRERERPVQDAAREDDEGAVGVDYPRQAPGTVPPGGGVPRTAHGTETGKVVGHGQGCDHPSQQFRQERGPRCRWCRRHESTSVWIDDEGCFARHYTWLQFGLRDRLENRQGLGYGLGRETDDGLGI